MNADELFAVADAAMTEIHTLPLWECPYRARFYGEEGHDPEAQCIFSCQEEPSCVTGGPFSQAEIDTFEKTMDAWNSIVPEDILGVMLELQKAMAAMNNPQPRDFIEGAVREAQFQQVRWDDKNKTDAEWFWTVGFLLSKILHRDETPERRQHHLTAAAGLLANWHAHIAAEPDDQTHSRDPLISDHVAAIAIDQHLIDAGVAKGDEIVDMLKAQGLRVVFET